MNDSYLSFIQSQIDLHLAEWSETYPKFKEFLARYQQLREVLCQIDPNGDHLCRYFVELAETVDLITCGYTYHRGLEVHRLTSQGVSCVPMEEPDLVGLMEAEYFPDPLMVEQAFEKAWAALSEPERKRLRDWNRIWAERSELLTGAALVWGYQSREPLGRMGVDLWMKFHLNHLLRPFGARTDPDALLS